MPKFPKYNRQVSSSAVRSRFTGKRANTDYAKALQNMGTNLERTGLTLADIDKKIKKIEQTRKTSDARISFQKIINESTLAFNENQNSKDWQGIYNGFERDMRGALNSIDDPEVKSKMSNEMEKDINDTLFSMKTKAVVRNVKKTRDNMEIAEQESLMAADTGDMNLILNAKMKFQQAVNENARQEGFSKGWVAQQILAADKKRAGRLISNAAATDPARALELLEDLSHNFSEAEISGVRKKIKGNEKLLEKARKEILKKIQDDNFVQYIQLAQEGDLSKINAVILDDLVAAGGLNRKEKEVIEATLYKGAEYTEVRNNEILGWAAKQKKVIDKVLGWGKKSMIEDWYDEGIRLYKNGFISKSEFTKELVNFKRLANQDVDKILDECNTQLILIKRASELEPLNYYGIVRNIQQEMKDTGTYILLEKDIDEYLSKYIHDYEQKKAVPVIAETITDNKIKVTFKNEGNRNQ